jgi:hypothetical protein
MKLVHRRVVVMVAILVALACAAGCKTNTIDNRTDNSTSPAGRAVIGPQGGVLLGPDGTSLRIPAGALTTDELISIRVAEPGEYPPLPGRYATLSKVFAFEPHGLQFLSPVIITLPYTDDGRGSAGVIAIRADGDAPADVNVDSWQSVAAQAAVDVQITTPSFSYYAVARALSGPEAVGSCSGRVADGTAPSSAPLDLTGTYTDTPAGSADPVTLNLFTLVDGYAVMNAGPGNVLLLSFTTFPRGCGHLRNGVAWIGGSTFSVALTTGQVAAGFYDGSAIRVSISGTPASTAPGACPAPLFDAGGPVDDGASNLTITEIDATHVAGAFDVTPVGGTRLTANFDLPLCTPNRDLSPALCCVP